MVPGLSLSPYLGYYPTFVWWMGICVVCGIVVTPWFAIFVLFRATDWQTALTGQVQKVWENRTLCSELYL